MIFSLEPRFSRRCSRGRARVRPAARLSVVVPDDFEPQNVGVENALVAMSGSKQCCAESRISWGADASIEQGSRAGRSTLSA